MMLMRLMKLMRLVRLVIFLGGHDFNRLGNGRKGVDLR